MNENKGCRRLWGVSVESYPTSTFNLEDITLASAMINHKRTAPKTKENEVKKTTRPRIKDQGPRGSRHRQAEKEAGGGFYNNMWICYLFGELWKSQQVPALCILFLIRRTRQPKPWILGRSELANFPASHKLAAYLVAILVFAKTLRTSRIWQDFFVYLSVLV